MNESGIIPESAVRKRGVKKTDEFAEGEGEGEGDDEVGLNARAAEEMEG